MSRTQQNGLVSVIIPTFNAARFLPAAIDSVLVQTYHDFEIIVVDDGSSDNTQEVISPYLERIRYIRKSNGGPASARNLGLVISKGEFIAFLDADDTWFPEKLEIQLSVLKENPQFGMVHSDLLISKKNREMYSPFIKNTPPSGNVFETLFLDNHIFNITVVVRRCCLLKAKGLDENDKLIGIEDYDLWLRIALCYEIGFIKKALAVYYFHDSNLSNEANIIKSQIYLVQKFSQNLKVRKKYPEILNAKKERLAFRYACLLIEHKNYKAALKRFLISLRANYLRFHSIMGIISCWLRIDIFFKSRVKALDSKQYGTYLEKQRKYPQAMSYYLNSLKNYPFQKIFFNYLKLWLKYKNDFQ